MEHLSSARSRQFNWFIILMYTNSVIFLAIQGCSVNTHINLLLVLLLICQCAELAAQSCSYKVDWFAQVIFFIGGYSNFFFFTDGYSSFFYGCLKMPTISVLGQSVSRYPDISRYQCLRYTADTVFDSSCRKCWM